MENIDEGAESDAGIPNCVAHSASIGVAFRFHVTTIVDANPDAGGRGLDPGDPFHGDNSRVVLRGASLKDLMTEVTILAVMGLALLAWSAARFRKKIA